MKKLVSSLALMLACSLPSPKAPSWEVTGTIPMVAKTVFVREVAETEDEFFFGDYGPWRFMDADSVLTSVLSDSMEADEPFLLRLSTEVQSDFTTGPTYWGGNPLDEIAGPFFYRAWLEVIVTHNLPGSSDLSVEVEGWDDFSRPCGLIQMSGTTGAAALGEVITDVFYAPSEDVLSFINPTEAHDVPDSFGVRGTATFNPTGDPIDPQPFFTIKVNLLTAIDLRFETTVVAKRAEVKKLVIAPEGEDTNEADISGDLTEKLRELTLRVEVHNNLPVGGTGFFKMAHDSSDLKDNPELIIGPFEIGAAPNDPITGKPTDVTLSISEDVLSETELDLFRNPGPGYDTLFASMEYELQGTGMHRVCISAPDSVRLLSIGMADLLLEPGEED